MSSVHTVMRGLVSVVGGRATVLLAALLLTAGGQAWADSLKFSEKYVTKAVRHREDGETFYDTVSGGSFSASASFVLDGLDISAFDESTPVSITIGSFGFSGVLGDAANYKPSRHSVTFVNYFENPDTGKLRKTLRVIFSWNKKVGRVSVAANTAYEASIAAVDLLQGETGPVSSDISGAAGLGDGGQSFAVSVHGRLHARVFRKGDDVELDIPSIAVSGRGVPVDIIAKATISRRPLENPTLFACAAAVPLVDPRRLWAGV